MKDEYKTKKQLIDELSQLRQKDSDLEASEAKHKQVMVTLQENEKKFRTLFETMTLGVVYQTADGGITSANPAAEQILGLSLDQMQGRTSMDPRWRAIHEDGSDFPGETHPSMIALATGKEVQDVVMGVFNPLYNEIRWLQINAVPQFVPGRTEPFQVYTTFRDITDRKRAEDSLSNTNRLLENAVQDLQNVQKQIIQQERLAAVGQLAAGIAHDFNNALVPITLYTETLLVREPDLSPDIRRRLGVISQQATKAASLTQQILDFSRKTVLITASLDLKPLLVEFHGMLKRTIPENVLISLEYDDGPHTINADINRLQQVFMNLALNSSDAMPQGGELCFKLSRTSIGPDERSPVPDMHMGHWVQLEVSDTGIGISAEDLPKIFEPFFTTKEAGTGSGLGLAQVEGIIAQHDAKIEVKSEVGNGTTISIFFPTLVEETTETFSGQTSKVIEGSKETVLIVEDDEPARDALRDVLEALNYRILTAESGVQALEIYGSNLVDIVLSDMVMPEMGAPELYRELQKLDPKVRMILITGYPLSEEGQDLLDKGVLDWIKKPFALEKLSLTLERALRN